MKIAFYIAFVIHMIAIIGVLALLVISYKKNPRVLNPGVLHASLTALIAGVVMVGTWAGGHPDDEINHTKAGIKFLVALAILVIGYVNLKKSPVNKNVLFTLFGLTFVNIILAYAW